MTECELLIERGTVIDGTGGPPARADVALADGRILAVGDLSEWRAKRRLNASERVVAPGFIDVHTHDEIDAVDNPAMTAKLSQGVTTVVAGNCGVSAAPLDPADPLPPPFPLLGDDRSYRFPTIDAYRQALTEARPAVNVALLAGHTSLRVGAMDDLSRPATAREIEAMQTALRIALDSGCIGLSSGVEYPPAAAATAAEISSVLSAMAGHTGAVYATHIRNERDEVLDAIDEAVATAGAAGVPLVISHHKCAGTSNHGRSVETLARIDEARGSGDVHLDLYPYTAGSTSLLETFAQNAESTIVTWSTPHPEMGGRRLEHIAAEWGCDRSAAIDRLSPAGAIYFLMADDDVERIMSHPATMIGSDGLPGRERPHPRLWGTFPRVLGRYVRELRTLELTEAVHKMTGLPASVFPLGRRGLVEEGAIADLVVFDPEEIVDTATYEDPERAAAGIDAVIVGGEITRTGDGPTGARNGAFVPREAN